MISKTAVRPLRFAGLLAVAALVGCAGSMPEPEPTFVLGATEAPLRYSLESINNSVIEIPGGGEQKIESTTSAMFSLSYGAATEAGLPFTLVYEAFEMVAAGAPAPDASEVLGAEIRGIVGAAGAVEVTDGPEISNPALSAEGLGQLIAGLAIPLPPEGDVTAESWDVSRTTPVSGGLEGSTTVKGTARFTDAMEWQGHSVRVIEAEGTMKQIVSGTPPGAPGEVEITTDGKMTSTYVWDHSRGVVLHAEQVLENEGTITVVAQGMVLPLTGTTTSTYHLLAE